MKHKYHFVHERGDYPLLAIEDIGISWVTDIKKTAGYNESPLYFLYEDGWCRIYSYEKVYQRIVDYVFNKVSRDKRYVYRIRKIFDSKSKKVFSFINKLRKTDFSKSSNKQLIKIKKEYSWIYRDFVPYGEPLPYFLKEKVQNLFDEYLVSEKKISPGEYNALVTPLYQSFLNREENELYKIVRKFKNNKEGLSRQIKKHKKKYEWILFDYASIAAGEDYFRDKAKRFISNPPVAIDYGELKKKKDSIIKKYKISRLYVNYIKMLEELFYLMDRKKEMLTRMNFAIMPLYREAGKRLGLSLDNTRWFFWREVEDALGNKRKLILKETLKRKRYSVVIFKEGKVRVLNLEGANRIKNDIERDIMLSNKEGFIKGISASPGKAIGRVCYLKSAKENAKMKKGNILLVSNTTPDFMPAIHKASAIVTNEGGMTSHAAIVSRELGVPCITGTRIATKVLKDGGMVEVDADRGIVRILR